MDAKPVVELEVSLTRLDEIQPEELKGFVETVEQDYGVRLVFKPQSPSVE